MFKIKISARARKELKIISRLHQEAIRESILELKERYDLGKALARELKGSFSYRVGVYRVIYRINKKDKVITITTAGHRATVYKKT